MPRQFDIGIISDSPLSRKRLKGVVNDLGYSLLGAYDSQSIDFELLAAPIIWLLDVGEEADSLLDRLFDSDAKLIFCDDSIPSPSDEGFNRWFKRMGDKIDQACRPKRVVTLPSFTGENAVPAIVIDRSDQCLQLPQRFLSNKTHPVNEIWVLISSLGGPHAIKEFVDLLPEGLPVAIVYAQHIYETQIESLSESLFRHCQLPIAKANEYDELQNGRIHIVPIDHSVLFLPGGVVKNTGEPWQAPYSPNHNQLLENMSQTWGDRCHCIVFSGMDNDGAIGNKHIVNAGGLVWCQSKDSATQPSMPDASAKLASYRGTPSELAYKLLNHIVVRGIGINEIQ